MSKCRSKPCQFCPYRKDVPSGVWHREEYEKLAEYDTGTSEQPLATFLCHADGVSVCTGWVAVGISQPHEKDLLAMRLWPVEGIDEIDPAIKYFANGTDACNHGLAEIENPGPESQAAIEILGRQLKKRK